MCKRFSIDLSSRKFHGALLDCQLLSEVYLELLGGKQTSLELTNLSNDKIDLPKDKKTVEGKKIYHVPVSTEEINNHKKIFANFKNYLWHKIDY